MIALDDNPRSLTAVWRKQLETALEAGETPVLALGWDTLHPDSLLPLAALDGLAHRRPGAIDPWVVAGGEGVLWLLGAARWPQGRRGGALYAGNDTTTFAASLTLTESPRSAHAGINLPMGMAWMLTPSAVPGAERAEGEYLPFALAPDEFTPLSAPAEPSDWIGGLQNWAVALLALGYLLLALFG
ncbi:MAG: hypothetical protein KF753_15825 [Caldilineaceae bacterium]|nr:hypothetical protein [Caldilineaceae bacterium]